MKRNPITLKKVIDGFFLLTLTMLLISCTTVQVNWMTWYQNDPDAFVDEYTVEISNGKETINPLDFFCSSSTYGGTEGDSDQWIMMDGIGASGYDMKANLNDIPSLTISPEMKLTVSSTASVGDVSIYDSMAVLVGTFHSWEDISPLSPGQYFFKFAIHNEVGAEGYSAECLFVLYVE